LSLLVGSAACTAPTVGPTAPPTPPTGLTVLVSDSWVVDPAVLSSFEQQSGYRVKFVGSGPADLLAQRLGTGEGLPEYWDLVLGIDGIHLQRALDSGRLAPYASAGLSEVPDELELDPSQRLLPVAQNYVTINADRIWFEGEERELPASLEDLRKPEFAGLLTLPSPEGALAGLGFLVATVDAYGQAEYTDFWRDLVAGGALITKDWTDSYLGAYTVGSGGDGDRPLALAYASAPAADAVFSLGSGDAPPSLSLDLPGGSFHQIEFVGLAADSRLPEPARALVDFMLGAEFQTSVADRMFLFPVSASAQPNEGFMRFAVAPTESVMPSPETLAKGLESWLTGWRGAVEGGEF
jgi:thiamine transport system substrate-binding protein